MIHRITMMGKNASTSGERKFCQECMKERWNGYYFFFRDLNEQGFFVCDDCLKIARVGFVHGTKQVGR